MSNLSADQTTVPGSGAAGAQGPDDGRQIWPIPVLTWSHVGPC
jgi:hypothetical protein